MTTTQAVLLGIGTALIVAALVIAAVPVVLRLRLRRLETRRKAVGEQPDYRLIVLPSRCTCCPVHGTPPTTITPREEP